MLYSSIENKKIKDIKKLNQKKYREQNKLFLVEGEHLVEEAYKAGYLESVIIEDGYSFDIEKNNIYVTDKVMNYISELEHNQHIMGICRMIEEKKELGNKILILDDIQDPGNLGTIIRSAVAFSFDTIILSKNTVDLYNSKVIRATQGLIFNINIIICDIIEFIDSIKSEYDIIGTKVDDGVDITTLKYKDKFALIMGNEGQGVSEEVLSLCNKYAHIKMSEKCESLNVGVATSIMLFELSK